MDGADSDRLSIKLRSGRQESERQSIDASTAQYAINTIQPLLAPFSPGTAIAKRLLINNTDRVSRATLPNIGNRLDDAGIDWRWYSGGWNDALANNDHG